MKKERKKKKLVIAAVALLAIVLAGLALFESRQQNRESASNEMPGVSAADLERQNGAVSGRTALLVIGIDKMQDECFTTGYLNNQQSDFVTLLIFNHEEKSYTAVHFNRDTVCDVTRYGVGLRRVDTVPMQLALSHTYGDGGDLSCRNTVESVNSLLPGIFIRNYACVTMEAVVELTNLCGGVPVEMDDDYTMVDSRFEKGLTLTLDGDSALEFIRMRRALADASNARRMNRQRAYLGALADTVIKKCGADQDFSSRAVSAVAPYLVSDAAELDLAEYMSWVLSYKYNGIITPEGEFDDSGKYVEFHCDEASLKEITEKYWK